MFQNRLPLVAFLLFTLVISFTACQKKEKPEPEKKQEVVQDTSSQVQKPEEPKIVIPDLKGTWAGTLYKRTATLKITEQDSLSFKGNLTVFFRDNINQTVKGKLDPTTLKVTMQDQVHNRAMGTYSGKLSEDQNILSGTFTMNADKSTHSFNFTKK